MKLKTLEDKKEIETISALADEFCRIPLNFTFLMRQNYLTNSIEISLRILPNTFEIKDNNEANIIK